MLFLHKYNYWGIAVISLSVTELLRRPREVLAGVLAAFRMVPWGSWLASQFRRPLNYVIVALLGITLAAVLNGGLYIETGGKRYGFKETRLFVNAAYVLLLIRLAFWWRSQGRAAAVTLGGEPFGALLVWAATPVLAWLALPFRLHYFVWYAGPGNNIGNVKRGPLDGLEYYFGGFVGEYHIAAVLAAIAAGLALSGLVALLRGERRSGWLVVPVAFVMCGTLTVLHPNQQMRFLHTWGPLLWVLAGVGIAAVLRLLARCAGHITAKVAAVGAVVGLSGALIVFTPAFAHISPAMGRGYGTPEASLRDLYEAYLPHIDGNEPTTILCNQPEAAWRWAFMEKFGHKTGLKSNLREAGVFDPVTADGVAKWLKSTPSRTVVYIEIPPSSPLFEPSGIPADNSAIRGVMLAQTAFKLEQRIRVKNLGTVYIWKR